MKHNYYQIILDNKEALATKEFGDMSKLLTINIDLGNLDNNFLIFNSLKMTLRKIKINVNSDCINKCR